jgi:ppGpp synthetase/RelA/SpoT-type nucleotidyltranferase
MATSTGSPAKKPIPFEEYPQWLAEHGVIMDVHEGHYNAASRQVMEAFQKSTFWQEALSALRDVDARYQIENAYPLISTIVPDLLVKPWSSFLEKTYRKNISENKKFPKPPAEGWCLPENWFNRIHDIIRTTIEVKYLDGVQLVLNSLNAIARQQGCTHGADLEARVDGYYAAHFNCCFECSVLGLNWKPTQQVLMIEIQVTTSMKAVIKRLLHTYYEDSRTELVRPSREEFSWNYGSSQFNAAYLGHILHYVEGMIIAVRKQQQKG